VGEEMTNPLIDKFYELHPEKKEEPKPDYYKGEKSYAEELKKVEYYELDPEFVKQLKNKSTLPTDPTTKKLPTLTSYYNDNLQNGFLQIAEKLKNKEAKVYSMNVDIDYSYRTKRITFEVWVNL
jgi:hypothetical protein